MYNPQRETFLCVAMREVSTKRQKSCIFLRLP